MSFLSCPFCHVFFCFDAFFRNPVCSRAYKPMYDFTGLIHEAIFYQRLCLDRLSVCAIRKDRCVRTSCNLDHRR